MKCKHYVYEQCEIVQQLADVPASPTPETCRACNRCSKPHSVNEVTVGLTITTLKENNLWDEKTHKYLLHALNVENLNSGPGSLLKSFISWFVTKPENCDCEDRALLMNAWGKEGCNQRIPTILGWLRESALDNNVRYSEFIIIYLVKLAILLAK